MDVTYDPAVFATPNLEDARRIILTSEGGMNTDERWKSETPYVSGLLQEWLMPKAGQIVVDYGCGVGRIAKDLIAATGCRVLGVDISEEMRGLAPAFVSDARFSVVSRAMFEGLIASGFRAHSAFSVWVLQHCRDPRADLALALRSLNPGSSFAVINATNPAIPVKEKRWASDAIDVKALVAASSTSTVTGSLDPSRVGAVTAEHSFWSVGRA